MHGPQSDPFHSSHDDLVEEICELTGLDRSQVERRVWKEALSRGSNVYEDALKSALDFHIYNEKMEKFYRETDSFIFETSVESCRPEKQELLLRVGERIENYLKEKRSSGEDHPLPLLMFGDGVGDTTLFLWKRFEKEVELFYFDIPGSKTYDFALKRFKKRKAPVHRIEEYGQIPRDFFNGIISLEVFEHLPDPAKMIQDIAGFLKVGGMALISEYFEGVLPLFPTHLKSNLKYSGKTPFLFLRGKLILTYYPKGSPSPFKPMEFIKVSRVNLKDRIKLLRERPVLRSYFYHTLARIARRLLS